MAPRREPERTCVGCRGRAGKRALLRVVRSPDGAVRVDPSGSAPGRGAYLHRDRGCVTAAFAKGALWRALRTGAPEPGAARLRADIEGESSA
ncbi:MAG TPA: YlxR family protein [Actinomycetota bacterium]|nr:YlxR family protein [Actinomycetota bacterium]